MNDTFTDATDGVTYLYDTASGAVLDAVTRAGEPLDVSAGYEVNLQALASQRALARQHTLAQVDARLAALEQQQATQPDPAFAAEAPLDVDLARAQWEEEARLLAADWGRGPRGLLHTEKRALAHEADASAARGGSLSLLDASAALAFKDEPGGDPPGYNKDDERVGIMAQRIEESEREQRALEYGDDDLVEPLEPWRPEHGSTDLDDLQQRQEYLSQRLMNNVEPDHPVYYGGADGEAVYASRPDDEDA